MSNKGRPNARGNTRAIVLVVASAILLGTVMVSPAAASDPLCSGGEIMDLEINVFPRPNPTEVRQITKNCTRVTQRVRLHYSLDYPARAACPADVQNVRIAEGTFVPGEVDRQPIPGELVGLPPPRNCIGAFTLRLILRRASTNGVLDRDATTFRYTA